MKIINKTEWRTDQLKAIIDRVAKAELDPEVRKKFVVRIISARTASCSGYAYYHSNEITVRLLPPKQTLRRFEQEVTKREITPEGNERVWFGKGKYVRKTIENGVNKPWFACVVAHEMAHARGMRHRQMLGAARYTFRGVKEGATTYRDYYAWANDYPVEPKPAKAKVEKPAEVVALKDYEHAKAKAAEWSRKLSTARRKAREWKAKARYYEKKAAALSAEK